MLLYSLVESKYSNASVVAVSQALVFQYFPPTNQESFLGLFNLLEEAERIMREVSDGLVSFKLRNLQLGIIPDEGLAIKPEDFAADD